MHIFFEALKQSRLPLLLKWLNQPYLHEFQEATKAWTQERVDEKFGPYTQEYALVSGEKKSINAFILHYGDKPIGYLQFYNAFDLPRKGLNVNDILQSSHQSLAAVDYFIGDQDYLKKGIGLEVLRKVLKEYIFNQYDACLAQPLKNNKWAIESYIRSGFSTVLDLDESIVMIANKIPKVEPLIIFGSSRSQGQTRQAINRIIEEKPIPVVDLKELNISYYDYEYRNREDDFHHVGELMVRHNPIILATPVYWYSMSAIMKTFIDRWTDLIEIRKDLGRRLVGKELFVITSYAGSIPKGFEDPFSQTCDYLKMNYGGCYYYYSGDNERIKNNNEPLAEVFLTNVWQKEKNILVDF